MSDEVVLDTVRLYGDHGVNPEERVQSQRFIVDICLATDLRLAGLSDVLARMINYSRAYQRVKATSKGSQAT